MTSAVRTRKQAASTPESNLSNVERLIFAQAVHEFGSGAWQEVAKLLSKHPLISQPKTLFTPQSCSALYRHLMDEAGLEWSETDIAPRRERHLRLAQRYYVARVTELRGLIAAEEAKFKQLVTEIDEIRSGGWDDKILASLAIEPEQPEEGLAEPEEPAPEPAPQPEPNQMDIEKDLAVQTHVEPEPATQKTPVFEETHTEVQDDDDIVDLSTAPEIEVETEEEKEEGTDNEAVNELIGDFGSDKPMPDAGNELEAPPPPPPPAEDMPADAQEEEMQVDEEPIKQEEEAEEETEAEAEAGATAEAQAETEVFLAEEPPADSVYEGEPDVEGRPARGVEAGSTVVEMPAEEQPAEEPIISPVTEPQTPTALELPSERSTRSEGKRKASDNDTIALEGQRERKRPREESEPVDEDEGAPKTRRRAGETHAVSKRFQNMIGMLHSQISQHRYGNIFHNPIKKTEAPDYHDIVKRPIDLKSIKSRVKDGLISNSLEFQRDIYLMFANAMMYNRPGSEIYNMAEEMMIASEREITAFRQTEGFHRM